MDKSTEQGSQFHSQKAWEELTPQEQAKFTGREEYEKQIALSNQKIDTPSGSVETPQKSGLSR